MHESELSQILAAAGPAHHQAYIETDRVDPEWSLWYSDFLAADLGKALGRSLTRGEIVYHLVDLQRLRAAEAPDAGWAEFYASHLIARRDAGSL